METTTWPTQYQTATKSSHGFEITEKVVSDCVNVYDISTIILGSLVSHLLYIGSFSDDSSDITSYLLFGLFAAIISSRSLHLAKIYDFRNLTRLKWQLSRVSIVWVSTMVGGLTIAFLTKSSNEISRGWFLLWFSGVFTWLIIGRIVIERLLFRWSRQGKFLRKLALITTESEKTAALHRLQDANKAPVLLAGVFGIDDISRFTRDIDVDEVIIDLPASERHRLSEVITLLSALPIDVNVAIDLPLPTKMIKDLELRSDELLGRVSDRPLKNWNALHKRLLDLIVAAIAVILLAPVMAVIAILIKLDSPGPVIFRQRRDGYGNHRFVIYKFRTLRMDATDANAERSVTKTDNRVTRMGRFLRRSSLDELPQFFNVIRGEMSIVGPRPHAISTKAGGRYFEDVVTNYIARHRVKPGITGWAQINGWRGETDSEEKILRRVEHDLYYIENWSLWLDIKIILKTVFVVFERSNAY
jgi:Undecaprenyl-phosphate glucose phosphotransferase